MTLEPVEDRELFAYVFETQADSFTGRINLFRVLPRGDSPRHAALETYWLRLADAMSGPLVALLAETCAQVMAAVGGLL